MTSLPGGNDNFFFLSSRESDDLNCTSEHNLMIRCVRLACTNSAQPKLKAQMSYSMDRRTDGIWDPHALVMHVSPGVCHCGR